MPHIGTRGYGKHRLGFGGRTLTIAALAFVGGAAALGAQPSITMSPAPLTHFSTPAPTITITACDPNRITSALFTLNGVSISPSTSAPALGCTGKRYTVQQTFNAGSNTLSTQVCASDGCNTMTAVT